MATENAILLLIEDDVTMARVYKEYLADEPYTVSHVETGKAALEEFSKCVPDVVVLDLKLPDMDGFDILKYMSERQFPSDVIVITGHGSMDTAIQAIKLGAGDFLVKPFSKDRLICTLRNTIERQNLSRIVQTYREEIDRHQYCGFIGSSLAMQGVYSIIDSAASSKATVFITGESGTGKEVCAEAIHNKSSRSKKPFIAINCGAIPKDLMESEIFGHVKGAFTGAINNRDGAALLADGGTLFLDEVCEMDLSLQPKLLRFLQTGAFQKVGNSVPVKVDVRILCASNRDPLVEVDEGRFREDLYYRLHVLPISLPPLREREGDIIEIARHFLAEYSKEEGKKFTGFVPETEEMLGSYDWPGNVRQLQNVVRNIIVLNVSDIVTPAMLPAPLDKLQVVRDGGPLSARANVPSPSPSPSPSLNEMASSSKDAIRPLADLEREAIENAIKLCEGNIPKAAYELGISTATIYRKRNSWRKGETESS